MSCRPEPGAAITSLLALFAVALVIAVVLPRRHVASATISHLRVLLPSWRFFDGLGTAPELLMRVGPSVSSFGPWQFVITVPPRRWRTLVWNPEGQLALASHALLERLQHELEEQPGTPPATLVAYQLVLNLVLSDVPAAAHGGVMQFQLLVRDTPDAPPTLLHESVPHAC
jgi:hypothetical protein